MRCRVLHLEVPPDINMDTVVRLFEHNGVKVDDCCSVSSRGRLIGLWIKEEDFDKDFTDFDQHCGRFWNE